MLKQLSSERGLRVFFKFKSVVFVFGLTGASSPTNFIWLSCLYALDGMSLKKILLTGGAGFIGSHLAARLSQEGHSVTILDVLSPYYSVELKMKNLEIAKRAGCKFVKGDILDYNFLETIMRDGVEVVYHEAAMPGVRASIENPKTPNEVNIEGTLNVLNAARKCDIEKVINASSSSVYGEVHHLPFDEKHPNTPLSPYAVSKLAAEQYAKVFHEVYGMATMSLRYFTVYGPRMRPDLAINIFTGNMLAGRQSTIFGDGEQTRDFTYIEDVVEANLKLLETTNANGQVFNVGSGRRITLNEIFKTLQDITGNHTEPIFKDHVKGDAYHTLADISKAQKLFGYDPKTTIEEGLAKYVEWFKETA